MLDNIKIKKIVEELSTFDKDELLWVNGYLNGLVTKNQIVDMPTIKEASKKVTIAYGTETGNSKRVASEFAAKAKTLGIYAKIQSLDQYKLSDLSKEEYFLAVISTHGDGEPPIAAKKFYDHVHSTSINLEKLNYSILALGDTSYPLYCKAGEDVDEQLNKLGARRLAPLQKCDVEYDTEAKQWIDDVLNNLKSPEKSLNTPIQVTSSVKRKGRESYKTKVLKHINLNDRGSNKTTYHIELEAEGIDYEPGDSLGLIPKNNENIVSRIIEISGIDESINIDYKGELISVKQLLTNRLNILYMPERIVKKYGSIIRQELPNTKMDLLDLLKIYPIKDSSQFIEVIHILEKITPRLYSIASSAKMHEGEIHLTVAKNSFKIDNQVKLGLASNYLASIAGQELEFYIHPNSAFRLPEEYKNIIMIGPGTGIAPFRSFLSERDVTGATGKNWLFFGEQHFVSDFLYQTEIQNWVDTGLLTKVSLAFSRDQEEKIYVQNKMREHSKEFFEWLDTGAYLYVCGSKEPMSVDVETEIIEIIMREGERSKQDAQLYLQSIKEDGRYILDVY
ncbi:MAG: assimilatory sulfite reductase (NADPH) flavoprotein subunit [Ginsengibacter sp.]